MIDSLQLGDKHRITTPVNWQPGEDVIVHPSVKDDEAKKLFPNFTTQLVSMNCVSIPFSSTKCFHVQPYLRTTPLNVDIK